MRIEVRRYVTGLLPRLSPNLLEDETISRSADLRDALENIWDQLTDEEREQVRAADKVLISEAARVAPFWRYDQTTYDREHEDIPRERWWWWLDEIADGVFPRELLPEA